MEIDRLVEYKQIHENDICYIHPREGSLVIMGRVDNCGAEFFNYRSFNGLGIEFRGSVKGAEEIKDVLIVSPGRNRGVNEPKILVGNNLEQNFF